MQHHGNDTDHISTPVEVSKTEARQGETGHHMRYMLGFGLAGTLIAFVTLGVIYFG